MMLGFAYLNDYDAEMLSGRGTPGEERKATPLAATVMLSVRLPAKGIQRCPG
jgi:hypothetical protein